MLVVNKEPIKMYLEIIGPYLQCGYGVRELNLSRLLCNVEMPQPPEALASRFVTHSEYFEATSLGTMTLSIEGTPSIRVNSYIVAKLHLTSLQNAPFSGCIALYNR